MKRGKFLILLIGLSLVFILSFIIFIIADGGSGGGSGGGGVISGESAPLFGTEKIYINNSLNVVKPSLTKSDLSYVLADESFSGNIDIEVAQQIKIGSYPRVVFKKQPTSADNPEFGLMTSTSYSHPIYSATAIFSKSVDFNSPYSKGEKIKLFGKEFIVSSETDGRYLVLLEGDEKITLTDKSSVTRGVEEDIVDGTFVEFGGSVDSMTSLKISVFASDSDNDAIKERYSFLDPVFGTFKIDFDKLNIGEYSSERETISINPSGNDMMTLSFTNYQDKSINNFEWLNNGAGGGMAGSKLGDSGEFPIFVQEMAKINESAYTMVGNEGEGYLVKLYTLSNSSSSDPSDDNVRFKNVFDSTQTWDASITSEGSGTVVIGGVEYAVTYWDDRSGNGDAYVQLNYPDSVGSDVAIVYPTIQTSKGAKLMFYEPLEIDLNNWDGKGNSLSKLRIPDGEGYTEIGINEAEVSVGELNFKIGREGGNVLVHLRDVSGDTIDNPALVIFEEKDDNYDYQAVIIRIEGNGDSNNGMGVVDVERTWGRDNTDWEAITSNDDYIMKEGDLWGTIITTDFSDADQLSAEINYPDEQVYAEIYVAEIIEEDICENHKFDFMNSYSPGGKLAVSYQGLEIGENVLIDLIVYSEGENLGGAGSLRCEIVSSECNPVCIYQEGSVDCILSDEEYCNIVTDCDYPNMIGRNKYYTKITDNQCSGVSIIEEVVDRRNACVLLDKDIANQVAKLRNSNLISREGTIVYEGNYIVTNAGGGQIWLVVEINQNIIKFKNYLSGEFQEVSLTNEDFGELVLIDGSKAFVELDKEISSFRAITVNEEPFGIIDMYYCNEKIEYDFKEGWNLINIFPVAELVFDDNERELNDKRIKAAFLYDKYNQDYIRLHPKMEEDKWRAFGEIFEPDDHPDNPHFAALWHSSVWIYSKKDQTLELGIPNEVEMLDINNVLLTGGWNFISITPQMIGNTLNGVKGDCEILKSAFWSPNYQNWDIGTLDDFETNIFTEDMLWRGLVIKVSKDCMMSNIPKPPELPVDDCVDEDGENYYVLGKCNDDLGSIGDSCIVGGDNDGWLREIVCQNNQCTTLDYECPNGCLEGVCI